MIPEQRVTPIRCDSIEAVCLERCLSGGETVGCCQAARNSIVTHGCCQHT